LNGAIVFSNDEDIQTKKPYEEIFKKAMKKMAQNLNHHL
jgi:hypothetical protein